MNLTQLLFSDEQLDAILSYSRISSLYLLRFSSDIQLYDKSPRTIIIGDRTFEVRSGDTHVDIEIREEDAPDETPWRAVRPTEKRWICKEYDRDQSELRTHLAGVFETSETVSFKDINIVVRWFKTLEANPDEKPASSPVEVSTSRITCLSDSIVEYFPNVTTNLKTVLKNGLRGMCGDTHDWTFRFGGAHVHIESSETPIVVICNLADGSYVIELRPSIGVNLLPKLFGLVILLRRLNDYDNQVGERCDTSDEVLESSQPIDNILKQSILRRVEHDINLPDDCLTGFTVARANDYCRVTFTGHTQVVRLYYKEHSSKQLYTCDNLNIVETHSAIVVLLAQYIEQLEREICSEIVSAAFDNTHLLRAPVGDNYSFH